MDVVVAALRTVDRITVETLSSDPNGARLGRELYHHISSTVEFGIDRVLEVYEDAAVFGAERSG